VNERGYLIFDIPDAHLARSSLCGGRFRITGADDAIAAGSLRGIEAGVSFGVQF